LDINKNNYQILKDLSSNNFILENNITKYIIKNIDGITPYYLKYLNGNGLIYEYIQSKVFIINYDILKQDLESHLFY
jgi:ankyrin repeat protein